MFIKIGVCGEADPYPGISHIKKTISHTKIRSIYVTIDLF
jgi:hypothetical protein